jgi:hypothetical protein
LRAEGKIRIGTASIDSPGYNRDRGPLSVVSLRGHIEAVASQTPD